MEKVEEKSKVGNRIFYIVLTLLILGAVGMTSYKIILQKDYQIVSEVSCDASVESCFHFVEGFLFSANAQAEERSIGSHLGRSNRLITIYDS